MTDARKLNPKPGQRLGKRILKPKKTRKRSAIYADMREESVRNRYRNRRTQVPKYPNDGLAEWERELFAMEATRGLRPARRKY